MALTAKQQQLLMDIKTGRVWSTGSRAYPRWWIADNMDSEGEQPVNVRTARSMLYRNLVRFTPHQTSPHVKWVELTDEGQREVSKYIADQDGEK